MQKTKPQKRSHQVNTVDKNEPSWKKRFIVVGMFFVGIGLTLGLYRWDYIQIQNISVEGTYAIDQEEVKDFIMESLNKYVYFWYPSKNIITIPISYIQDALQYEYPRIKNIYITRIWPNSLDIQVEERNPMWKICTETQCLGVSEEGFIIDEVPKDSLYPLLEIKRAYKQGDKFLSDREVLWIQTIIQNLKNQLQITPLRIQEIDNSTEDLKVVEVYIDEDTYLLIDDETDVVYQIRALRELFEAIPYEERLKKKYYDLRIKKRIYYE